MTNDQKEAAISDIEAILKAVEPWLLQLIRWNPSEENVEPVRRKTAEDLFEIAEGAFKRDDR